MVQFLIELEPDLFLLFSDRTLDFPDYRSRILSGLRRCLRNPGPGSGSASEIRVRVLEPVFQEARLIPKFILCRFPIANLSTPENMIASPNQYPINQRVPLNPTPMKVCWRFFFSSSFFFLSASSLALRSSCLF